MAKKREERKSEREKELGREKRHGLLKEFCVSLSSFLQLSVSSKHLEEKEALAQQLGNVGFRPGLSLNYSFFFYVPWFSHLDTSRLEAESSMVPSDLLEVSSRRAASRHPQQAA